MDHVHRRQGSQAAKWPKALPAYVLVACAVIGCAIVAWGQTEEPDTETIGIVIDALKGSDESMQSMAIALVREMPGPEVTKVLAKELPNLSVKGQVQLLSALADRGDRTALPAVVVATKSKDQSVRVAALKALGGLGDAASVSLLAGTAAATRGTEQKAARESLYRLRGPKIDETILSGLAPAGPKVKVELIRSTGERNITAGVDILLKTARDKDAKVRRESLRVLRTIAGPGYMPALVELLIAVKSSTDRREAEKTVTVVAHKISDRKRQAEAVLAKLPSIKEVTSRCSLLKVLGKIGQRSALAVLRTGLKDKNVKVQEACIRALAEWPTAEPAADLVKVVEGSDNQLHRVLAFRGFVRLIGLDSSRPAQERIARYTRAMLLASNVSEKKMVLSGLANVNSIGALQMAVTYLKDKTLQEEAEVAVVKIAEATAGSRPAESKAALQKVSKITTNEFLREQVQKLINQIKEK